MRMNAEHSAIKKGMIMVWYGTIASIPKGWATCDGNNGTPDLRHIFVRGASPGAPPGETGGADAHSHTFSDASHFHALGAGGAIASGTGFSQYTGPHTTAGITEQTAHIPRYHSLCYIMKL